MKAFAVALLLLTLPAVHAADMDVKTLPPPPPPAASPAKPATAPSKEAPGTPAPAKPATASVTPAESESKAPAEKGAPAPNLPPPPPPAATPPGEKPSVLPPPPPATMEGKSASKEPPAGETAPKLPPPPPASGEKTPVLPPPPPPGPAPKTTAGGAPSTLPPPPPPGAVTPTKPETPAKKPTASEPAPGTVAVKLPPPKGSRIPPDKVACFNCHTDKGLWDEKTMRLYIPKEKLASDVHFNKGVNCQDCHGGNPESEDVRQAHATDDGFRSKPEEIKKYCIVCHKDQSVQLTMGVHARAGAKDDRGAGTRLSCDKCHGQVSHATLPVQDMKSPVRLGNQVNLCGNCHPAFLETYTRSVHGHGLFKSGLSITAVCSNCHGAHAIFDANDARSSLHPRRVAHTCGKCHQYIEEKLQGSIHGSGGGPGAASKREAPGGGVNGNGKRKPSCTDCHQGHDQPNPEAAFFRQQLPYRCGNCHTNLSGTYSMSIHGELTELGYGPAAKCSDCHGAHDILPASNSASRLSKENRAEACRQCHPNAAGNFLHFDPHVDYTDPSRGGAVRTTYLLFLTLLISTFGLFGLHSVLWFVRSTIDVWKHRRPKGLVPGHTAYVRFSRFHRWGHAALLTSFLGLALTGLPLKYNHTEWGKNLSSVLGGFYWTSAWHRFFGLVTFACFIMYMVKLAHRYVTGRKLGRSRRGVVFGPDSPVPTLRDVKDFFRMVRWFVGLGPKPTFERWSYWEKFDFWGACADIIIIGATGLVLWFPNFFGQFLPGISLNIAKVIHSTQALLATGFVFAIHFFNTHLRAEKFPADMSVLTGLVSEEEMREERPELLERLRQEGELESRRTTVPSRKRLWLIRALGFIALGIGLALLVGMILAGLGG